MEYLYSKSVLLAHSDHPESTAWLPLTIHLLDGRSFHLQVSPSATVQHVLLFFDLHPSLFQQHGTANAPSTWNKFPELRLGVFEHRHNQFRNLPPEVVLCELFLAVEHHDIKGQSWRLVLKHQIPPSTIADYAVLSNALLNQAQWQHDHLWRSGFPLHCEAHEALFHFQRGHFGHIVVWDYGRLAGMAMLLTLHDADQQRAKREVVWLEDCLRKFLLDNQRRNPFQLLDNGEGILTPVINRAVQVFMNMHGNVPRATVEQLFVDAVKSAVTSDLYANHFFYASGAKLVKYTPTAEARPFAPAWSSVSSFQEHSPRAVDARHAPHLADGLASSSASVSSGRRFVRNAHGDKPRKPRGESFASARASTIYNIRTQSDLSVASPGVKVSLVDITVSVNAFGVHILHSGGSEVDGYPNQLDHLPGRNELKHQASEAVRTGFVLQRHRVHSISHDAVTSWSCSPTGDVLVLCIDGGAETIHIHGIDNQWAEAIGHQLNVHGLLGKRNFLAESPDGILQPNDLGGVLPISNVCNPDTLHNYVRGDRYMGETTHDNDEAERRLRSGNDGEPTHSDIVNCSALSPPYTPTPQQLDAIRKIGAIFSRRIARTMQSSVTRSFYRWSFFASTIARAGANGRAKRKDHVREAVVNLDRVLTDTLIGKCGWTDGLKCSPGTCVLAAFRHWAQLLQRDRFQRKWNSLKHRTFRREAEVGWLFYKWRTAALRWREMSAKWKVAVRAFDRVAQSVGFQAWKVRSGIHFANDNHHQLSKWVGGGAPSHRGERCLIATRESREGVRLLETRHQAPPSDVAVVEDLVDEEWARLEALERQIGWTMLDRMMKNHRHKLLYQSFHQWMGVFG